MDIFHKKERDQLVAVLVVMSLVIAMMAIILGYFVWHDSTRTCPASTVITNEKQVFAEAIDSDQDGLADADELGIYKTDPKKADTDGDGYADGTEVRGGYDPLVPAEVK